MANKKFHEVGKRQSNGGIVAIGEPKDFIKDKNDADDKDVLDKRIKEQQEKEQDEKRAQEKQDSDKRDDEKRDEDRGRALFSEPDLDLGLHRRIASLEATVAQLLELVPGQFSHFIAPDLRPDLSPKAAGTSRKTTKSCT
jgi:hypothetical protein